MSTGGYTHVAEEMKDWPKRCRLIVDRIVFADADIVCLQECEFVAFSSDLLPALSAAGYDGLMQKQPSGRQMILGESIPHPQGVATFWKHAKLERVGECHRSRTSVVHRRIHTTMPLCRRRA